MIWTNCFVAGEAMLDVQCLVVGESCSGMQVRSVETYVAEY